MSGFPPVAPPPAERFVRLRHPDSPSGAVTATFVAAPATPPGGAPTARVHPLVTDLKAREPERAARIAEGLRQLLQREEELLNWMEADPAHPAAFARDPLGAVHHALPDLTHGFFDGWRRAERP